MRLLCALGRHRPSSKVIPNEGRIYSRCTICNADLIKVGRGWRTAPPGYRVIWKEAEAEPAPAEAEEAATKPAAGKRRRTERRVSREKQLPAKLGGKERRRGTRDRRSGFGKRPDQAED